MKEQLQEDNFERFLKGKLNEFDDEPQAQMWNRIESVIPPAPKPVFYSYFTTTSIAASVLFAVALVAGLYQYQSNQVLNDKLVEANEKIKGLEAGIERDTMQMAEIEDKNSLNPKSGTIQINSEQINSDKANDIPIKMETPKNMDNHNATAKNLGIKSSKKESGENQAADNKKSRASKANILNNKKIETAYKAEGVTKLPSKKEEKNATLTPLENTLNTLPPMANEVDLNRQKNEAAPLSPKEETNEVMPAFIKTLDFQDIASENKIDRVDSLNVRIPDLKHNGWEVGVFVQPLVTHTSFRRKRDGGKPGPVPDFSKHRIKPALGWAATANFGYRANKHWAFYGGVTYQKEFAYLDFSEGLKYNKDFETDMNNEQQNYEQSYEANSPFGNIGLNVRFSKNKSDNIPSETDFEVNIKGVFESTSLNIPLYVQYQTQQGRLKYGAKIGFASQIVLDKSFITKDLYTTEVALKPIETKVSEQPKWEHKVSIDNLLGVSLAYSIAPNLDLSIEPTALFSVSSPHRTDRGSLSRVSSGVQMGMRYAF